MADMPPCQYVVLCRDDHAVEPEEGVAPEYVLGTEFTLATRRVWTDRGKAQAHADRLNDVNPARGAFVVSGYWYSLREA